MEKLERAGKGKGSLVWFIWACKRYEIKDLQREESPVERNGRGYGKEAGPGDVAKGTAVRGSRLHTACRYASICSNRN